MNRLTKEERARVLGMLCEGMAIRAVSRLTGVSKTTIAKLLDDAGRACAGYQNRVLRNLPCKRVQVDEIWSFVYAKHGNVSRAKAAPVDAGDVWTWTALCADTKLLVTYLVGDRTTRAAIDFIEDLRDRLSDRIQLTSDGHQGYLEAVYSAFGRGVDYAQIIKIYGKDNYNTPQKRYSAPACLGARKQKLIGRPKTKDISTSYVERHNLTMRMHMRRFTRLTNAHSKRIENHAAAVALHSMFYNFTRKQAALKMTPAMAAGVTDRAWTMEDIVEVIEAWETKEKPATI